VQRNLLIAAASLAVLMPCSLLAAQSDAQEVVMPEVKVTGTVPESPHPQDGNYSDRPLGCVEIVTPSGTGNELGGYFFARFAPSSVSVMPSLNDPSSANDTRPDLTGREYQAIEPGTMSSTPQCP
jgi:hypothetical protein